MRPARDRFASSAGILGMIDPEIEARTMTAFLLHFSAFGISFTEPGREMDYSCRRKPFGFGTRGNRPLFAQAFQSRTPTVPFQQYRPSNFLLEFSVFSSRKSDRDSGS